MKKQRAIMINKTTICHYALYLYQLGYSVSDTIGELLEELPEGWDNYTGVIPHIAPLFIVYAAGQAEPTNTANISLNATQPAGNLTESLTPSLF